MRRLVSERLSHRTNWPKSDPPFNQVRCTRFTSFDVPTDQAAHARQAGDDHHSTGNQRCAQYDRADLLHQCSVRPERRIVRQAWWSRGHTRFAQRNPRTRPRCPGGRIGLSWVLQFGTKYPRCTEQFLDVRRESRRRLGHSRCHRTGRRRASNNRVRQPKLT